MTTFADLPQVEGYPTLRWVGASIMDEEQFTVEGWTFDGCWRVTVEGIRRYGELCKRRREEKRSSWKARVDAEEEYSEQMTTLIEGSTR